MRPTKTPEAADTPHDPLFDSAWLKWGRAVVHALELAADIEAVLASGPDGPHFAIDAEYQPRRHGFAITVVDIDPMPPTWGLLVGDFANNMRSALDHVAWALVTRGRTPPSTLTKKAQKQVYFPISGKREVFNGCLETNLPGVRRADIARVRKYQPYHHGSRGRWFSWLLLSRITAADKHRSVAPVWAIPLAADFQITGQRDCVLTQHSRDAIRSALEPGVEIGFVRARKTGPDPWINVVPHLVCEPMIEGRAFLLEWLKLAVWWTQLLLYEFSEPPDSGMQRLGIDGERFKKVMEWKPPAVW